MLAHAQIIGMQGCLLFELKGADHIIELLGRGPCHYNGETWSAILVAPLVRRLHDVDDLTLFGQVCHYTGIDIVYVQRSLCCCT